MSSIIAARPDHLTSARSRYASLGRLPRGFKSWDEFCLSLQRQEEDNILFALSLMEEPPPENGSTFVFYHARDMVVFGVLAKRDDGKLGRRCFHDQSSQGNSLHGVVACDGFDESTLRLEPETATGNVNFFDKKIPHCRISRVHIDQEDVLEQLASFMYFQIGSLADGSGDGKRLAALRQTLLQVFPREMWNSLSDKITELFHVLDTKISRYLSMLEQRRERMRGELDELEELIKKVS